MIYHGDCLSLLPALALAGDEFDSCVTDPPYGLSFMGKDWDHGVPGEPFWRAIADVLKPGAHLLAFGGTRTFHRLAVAIEDAGFEIRDTIMWVYGSGFPKSHNQPGGWGTALKPAWEPIIVARKPLVGTVAANIALHGTGAINVDGCRVPSEGGCARSGEPSQDSRYAERGATNFAALPGPRGGAPEGRWPANLIHDGSDEVLAGFPAAPGQIAKAAEGDDRCKTRHAYGVMTRGSNGAEPRSDSGSAARFFYCAKASKADRAGSKHPTVKPLALMRYLCRLVTPPGGTVLDPFAGSGTTLAAAVAEGFHAVGIEREAEYVADIQRRLTPELEALL